MKVNIRKYHTKYLKDVYDDIIRKESSTKFLSSIAKKITKELGVTPGQKTISFSNFFKVMEILGYEIEFKISVTNLDGVKTEYVTSVDGMKKVEDEK